MREKTINGMRHTRILVQDFICTNRLEKYYFHMLSKQQFKKVKQLNIRKGNTQNGA